MTPEELDMLSEEQAITRFQFTDLAERTERRARRFEDLIMLGAPDA